ncbi:MAG TPA: glycosyltransferase family 4 protein [Polyangiaceae bacterium]
MTELVVLHPALCDVGGAEVLMVEQATLLAGIGASVRIRTAAYDSAYWSDRIGSLKVEALATGVQARRKRTLRSPSDPRMTWLLRGLGGARVAIAHNYPTSSALGASGAPIAKIWYCHEPPRSLYPAEASPYLAANVGRAPERDGPRYYRTSLNGWFGGLPLIGRRRPARLAADRLGVSRLDAIWANSEFTRDNVRRIYGSVSVDVVYPTVEPPPVERRSGAARDGLRILTLTRLHAVKNLDTLIEGFAAFRRTQPRAELHIVGDGPHKASLERLVAPLGLEGAVRIHGFLPDDDLAALSSSCDAFACVPLDEPFGMVFPESMARGLLVLGPNHGGPLEILDGGRLGEAVDPLDPEAVADGLFRIARLSNADADARREAAASSVKERFSRPATAERMKLLLARHGLG